MRTARRTAVIVLGLVALGLVVWGLGAWWASMAGAAGFERHRPSGADGLPLPDSGLRPDGPGGERQRPGGAVGAVAELGSVAVPLALGTAIWFVARFLRRRPRGAA